jgi:hypothetical protein
MSEHLSKKNKKKISNRFFVVIGLLIICATLLFPLFNNVPFIIIAQVLLAAFAIGALSGFISNGLLKIIFGLLLTISAAGTIVNNHPEYLQLLLAPALIGLVVASNIGGRIVKRSLTVSSVRFQFVVSITAVVLLVIWSMTLPFYLNTPAPLAPILIAVSFALLSGYFIAQISGRRKMMHRKSVLIITIIISTFVIGILMVYSPVLLMVSIVNIFNGMYIGTILQQPGFKLRS